jgi:hypothetical protein
VVKLVHVTLAQLILLVTLAYTVLILEAVIEVAACKLLTTKFAWLTFGGYVAELMLLRLMLGLMTFVAASSVETTASVEAPGGYCWLLMLLMRREPVEI